jgi:hypothetical protein
VGEPKARTVTILLRWLAVPSLSAPKEMDRVIGAPFSVLAQCAYGSPRSGRAARIHKAIPAFEATWTGTTVKPAHRPTRAVRAEVMNWGLGDTTVDPGEVLLPLVTQSAAQAERYAMLLEETYEAAERLKRSFDAGFASPPATEPDQISLPLRSRGASRGWSSLARPRISPGVRSSTCDDADRRLPSSFPLRPPASGSFNGMFSRPRAARYACR